MTRIGAAARTRNAPESDSRNDANPTPNRAATKTAAPSEEEGGRRRRASSSSSSEGGGGRGGRGRGGRSASAADDLPFEARARVSVSVSAGGGEEGGASSSAPGARRIHSWDVEDHRAVVRTTPASVLARVRPPRAPARIRA